MIDIQSPGCLITEKVQISPGKKKFFYLCSWQCLKSECWQRPSPNNDSSFWVISPSSDTQTGHRPYTLDQVFNLEISSLTYRKQFPPLEMWPLIGACFLWRSDSARAECETRTNHQRYCNTIIAGPRTRLYGGVGELLSKWHHRHLSEVFVGILQLFRPRWSVRTYCFTREDWEVTIAIFQLVSLADHRKLGLATCRDTSYSYSAFYTSKGREWWDISFP